MTCEELWRAYVRTNPEFANPESHIHLTGRGLRKFFDETWRHAVSHGARIQREPIVLEELKKIFS
jgi:hypothetical protein